MTVDDLIAELTKLSCAGHGDTAVVTSDDFDYTEISNIELYQYDPHSHISYWAISPIGSWKELYGKSFLKIS